MILVLGKARSHRALDRGCRGTESSGWFDVLPKNFSWDVMHDWACCCDEAANHQLLIAVAFSIIQIVSYSVKEFSTLRQNLVQICCSTCSVLLNVMATQHTCLLNLMYHPRWLVQRSCHCSRTHSSPLSLAARLHQCRANHSYYINNGWAFSR